MPRGIPEPWDEEMLARAAGMKRAGLSTATIANRLGVSVKSVTRRLSKIGAKRRLDGHGGGGGKPINTGNNRLTALDLRDAFNEERGAK